MGRPIETRATPGRVTCATATATTRRNTLEKHTTDCNHACVNPADGSGTQETRAARNDTANVRDIEASQHWPAAPTPRGVRPAARRPRGLIAPPFPLRCRCRL